MARPDRAARSIAVEFLFLIPRLRLLAGRLLSSERPGHTLQATALVNEAFMKVGRFRKPVADQAHLFNLCARAMRQVLVDHGRARKARLGLEAVAHSLAAADSEAEPEMALAVRSAFQKLKQTDTMVAGTLRLRFIDGHTLAEISRLQKRPEWRVRADCDFGLSWIRSNL